MSPLTNLFYNVTYIFCKLNIQVLKEQKLDISEVSEAVGFSKNKVSLFIFIGF